MLLSPRARTGTRRPEGDGVAASSGAPGRGGARLAGLLACALALAGAPTAEAQGACPDGMKLVAGGRFTLADGSEVAEVEALCLDETEVTAGAYEACVARGACDESGLRCGKAATYGAKNRQAHPVNCVAWTDAEAFCRALGKRLPSEAEWEWAARGRLRALTFPWGNTPPGDQACWDGPGNALGKGGRNDTCPVAAHPRSDSPDGFHDLAGNVREWTGTTIGRDRVVRGGSWGDSLPDFLAAGFRGMNKPDERFEITGFRCAAAPGLAAAAPARPSEPARPPPTSPADAALVVRAGEVSAEELEEEEGVVVAPPDYEPPVRTAPPPPPPREEASPTRPAAAQAQDGGRPAPREQVEFGEIKIQSLTGVERR